jgi:N-acylglucosamine 2-epimerase
MVPTAAPASLEELGRLLRQHLLHEVMPFWVEHAIDPAGGLNTCIRDDGTMVNGDKWLWSQWRAVWVFSRLYRTIDANPRWLEIAWHICHFAAEHGWDHAVGGWVLRVDGQGKVIDGCDSIYVDAFAIYGLTELAAASGSQQPLDLARQTADQVLTRLLQPHDRIPHFPYPVPPGARVHGIPMMFSLVLWELGQLASEDRYRQAALSLQQEIFTRFYRADRDVILERVAADGSEYPPPLGTAVVPGHVIEDMWFQIHIARDRGDAALIGRCLALMRRHMELGWDHEFGGLRLAVDADGRADVGWKFADAKLWWPHTEALYALLLAHQLCGEPWCLEWYRRVHEAAFTHYPVREHGEWRQKLDRRFQPIKDLVGLPVKDPFHLPRALTLAVELLESPSKA